MREMRDDSELDVTSVGRSQIAVASSFRPSSCPPSFIFNQPPAANCLPSVITPILRFRNLYARFTTIARITHQYPSFFTIALKLVQTRNL
ncbi:hypothetical protein CC1G_14083 [Coprinopsis cinerea okayama7|uniref:Uncharacterized protein n=1 Tax=Coprinopsis cinerea (strain Okayama-7 / 130 / ATCC MYA-4618 / FGSC 9003) TaxID=240176 RepID=D6RLA1_COPC7|nr:hypothetical protein CC1G_14083 [Coprinopsis cinerea okayama7\|eukprot:XP_002911551.1 hypothetical protein CC1G_14083 [Coprinopsis cinerea okayama7\